MSAHQGAVFPQDAIFPQGCGEGARLGRFPIEPAGDQSRRHLESHRTPEHLSTQHLQPRGLAPCFRFIPFPVHAGILAGRIQLRLRLDGPLGRPWRNPAPVQRSQHAAAQARRPFGQHQAAARGGQSRQALDLGDDALHTPHGCCSVEAITAQHPVEQHRFARTGGNGAIQFRQGSLNHLRPVEGGQQGRLLTQNVRLPLAPHGRPDAALGGAPRGLPGEQARSGMGIEHQMVPPHLGQFENSIPQRPQPFGQGVPPPRLPFLARALCGRPFGNGAVPGAVFCAVPGAVFCAFPGAGEGQAGQDAGVPFAQGGPGRLPIALHPLAQAPFEAHGGGFVKNPSPQALGQILLGHPMIPVRMGIEVALPMAEPLGVPVGVFQVIGHVFHPLGFHGRQRIEKSEGRVALGRRGQIQAGLGQVEPPLRQAYVIESLGRAHHQPQGVGIGQSHVFRGENDHAAKNEAGVLARVHHARHPV